jgi:hypothetical protein
MEEQTCGWEDCVYKDGMYKSVCEYKDGIVYVYTRIFFFDTNVTSYHLYIHIYFY